MISKSSVISVVGMGYVGFPLAYEFSKFFKCFGFDISTEGISKAENKLAQLRGEAGSPNLGGNKLVLTNDEKVISESDFIIVTVPTPVDNANIPDFSHLKDASRIIGNLMKPGAFVIFESTVYPGATEEICKPILEECSGLKCSSDFFLGYSPERVSPGDETKTVTDIVKLVSADTKTSLEIICELYSTIIPAGIHATQSIKEAEAAKVIENTQRDLNIALVNELSIIFGLMGIDTDNVLKAADTKWNFHKYSPGLVGGHCIGVDPYYLTHKAEMLGYHPELIKSGRRINDNMATFVAQKIVKTIGSSKRVLNTCKLGIMGVTFKENCDDIRNSKVIDMIEELQEYGISPALCDPVVDRFGVSEQFKSALQDWAQFEDFDILVLAVPHRQFISCGIDGILKKLKSGGLFVDLKSVFPAEEIRERGYDVWRL